METADRDKYGFCFACGKKNPIGLKLDFRFEDEKARAEFTPGPYHESWNGVFHGGLLAVCLDEAFGYVLYFQGLKGMTARMEMRIRKTVRTGQKILLTGEVRKRSRKIVETYARAEFEDGTLAAEATAAMYLADRDSPKSSD